MSFFGGFGVALPLFGELAGERFSNLASRSLALPALGESGNCALSGICADPLGALFRWPRVDAVQTCSKQLVELPQGFVVILTHFFSLHPLLEVHATLGNTALPKEKQLWLRELARALVAWDGGEHPSCLSSTTTRRVHSA